VISWDSGKVFATILAFTHSFYLTPVVRLLAQNWQGCGTRSCLFALKGGPEAMFDEGTAKKKPQGTSK